MRYRYTLIIIGLFSLVIGVNLIDEKQPTAIVDKVNTGHGKNKTKRGNDKHPLPEVEVALVGQSFTLYKGIKTVLDHLIFEADSENLNTILNMATHYCLEQRYSTDACSQFSSLYSRYVNYKYALVQVDEQHANLAASADEIEYQLSRIQRLQLDYFSQQEQHILFSTDNVLNEQALARRAIAHDPILSKQQKKRLLIEHLEQLPADQKSAFVPSLKMQTLATIKNTYQNKQQRLIEVENQLGYDAAQRLEKTWRQQETFEKKVKQITKLYHSFAQNENVQPDRVKAQQNALLAQHFSENQQKRVRVMLENKVFEQ